MERVAEAIEIAVKDYEAGKEKALDIVDELTWNHPMEEWQ